MSILSSSILGISLVAFPLTASASKSVVGPEITLVDEAARKIPGSGAKASSGRGHIKGSNPLFFKPRAVASTIMKSGTGWVVKVKIVSKSGNKITSTTGWHSLNNTNKVTTQKLVASTEKATFIGYHELKKTKTSSWEVAKTSISFK